MNTNKIDKMQDYQYLIQCPECGKEFPMENVLKEKFQQEWQQEFEQEKNILVQKTIADTIATQQQIRNAERAKLEKTIADLEQSASQIREEARKETAQQILQLKNTKEEYAKDLELAQKQITTLEKQQLDYQTLQSKYNNLSNNLEIEKKKVQIEAQQAAEQEFMQKRKEDNELNEKQMLMQKQRYERDIDAIRFKANEEAKLQVTQELTTIQDNFQQQLFDANEKHKQQLLEKEEALRQVTRKAEELQKSLQQGSMQIQGEAQEKYLVRCLTEQADTKFDKIEGKKTGVPESDIKQIVTEPLNNILTECGVILYESKNTNNFSKDWIPKLKKDGQTAKADILVLVTQAMPANSTDLHREDDVWICPVSYFNVVSKTLRRGLVDTYRAGLSQQNRKEKMDKLYDFMISPAFNRYMKGIIQGINRIQSSYEKEKKALMTIWKKREREFQDINDNYVYLFAELQAIESSIHSIDSMDILHLAGEAEEYISNIDDND